MNINFEDKYTCLICKNIIENEKPCFCFRCQKLYHKDCLIAWKNSNEENDNDFKCPACNYELEFENLKEKIDYEDNKNREEKSIKKIEEYMEYKSKVIPLLKYIYGEINEIKSLLKIKNIKSQKNSENNIPNIIKNDLNYIKIFLNTIFSNNEYIEPKYDNLFDFNDDQINIIYKKEKKKENKNIIRIFGKEFVKNNKDK